MTNADSPLKVRNIALTFETARSRPLPVLNDVSFEVFQNSICVVVGPSGCGKTTLLNLIAGLLRPTEGWIEAMHVTQPFGYVFQTASLIPWLSVWRNALFGAEIGGRNDANVKTQCRALMQRFGLEGFEQNYPNALSGGMQQRVSIIRAVLSGAKVILLDEPFSNSDFLVRQELQREVSRLVDEEQLVAILVTHDIEEAVRIADKVIVLTHRPARVKAEIEIPVPRAERLVEGAASVQLIAPYLERVWEVLKAPDPPLEVAAELRRA